MPTYRYYCQKCGESFDKRLAISELEHTRIKCPRGHDQVQRMFSAPAIIYKGSGWYSKDHAKQSA
ncbi:MAG: zinc ribbon domain-containing protein [Anaerolineaceae bacterium]|nr:zinc ribbon domain-containing protein [Anaerolineaceae bacterium]